MGTVCKSGFSTRSPSMAEATEMGGVMMPSASSAAAPMMAGRYSHLMRKCRNRANSARMPPSPRLSALSAMSTYLTVVSSVSVQTMQEMVPRMTSSVTGRLANTPRTV